jgi:sugar lactone lactonase YvrE
MARREHDETTTVLADRYQGERLNSSNDLVYRSNGDLYFTDPPFGLRGTYDDPDRELPFQGVYRLSPDGTLTWLSIRLDTPNVTALSPDERTLYVSNARGIHVFVPDGTRLGRIETGARPATSIGARTAACSTSRRTSRSSA